MKRGALYSFGWYLLYPIFKLLFFFKVNGRENIPENGGFILCSNHLSNFDPVLLALSQKRQIFYMAKAELFKNKFFGALIRKLGAFPVERGAGDGKAIEMAESIIKDEKMLGIFIEGTRSKTGEFLRPKSGAAIIAHQMKATVIPVIRKQAQNGADSDKEGRRYKITESTAKAASAYDDLRRSGEDLMSLIEQSQGGANKDIRALTEEITELIEKYRGN